MKKLLSVCLLAAVMAGCSSNSGSDNGAAALKGSATEAGFGGDVTVEVTVTDGKITDLTYTAEGETEAIGGAACETLKTAMIEAGNADVEAVSGATISSEAFIKAAKAAVEAAK